MTSAESAILKALAWHALFNFPLTVEEARLAAPIKLTLAESVTALDTLRAIGRVGERSGLYFIAGRENDTTERLARQNIAEHKYRRARRFVAMARLLPFVRGIFICNTLARSGATASSDIDLFVIAADRHVWTARLFVTGLAAILNIRPTPRDATDGICLSFYVSESSLDLQPMSFEGDAEMPRWIADFYPLYDESRFAERFFEANRWILATVPNAQAPRGLPRRSLKPRLLTAKHLIERVLVWLEPLARRFQKFIMPPALLMGGPGVVINDSVLKLHRHDQREEHGRRFKGILRSLSLES